VVLDTTKEYCVKHLRREDLMINNLRRHHPEGEVVVEYLDDNKAHLASRSWPIDGYSMSIEPDEGIVPSYIRVCPPDNSTVVHNRFGDQYPILHDIVMRMYSCIANNAFRDDGSEEVSREILSNRAHDILTNMEGWDGELDRQIYFPGGDSFYDIYFDVDKLIAQFGGTVTSS
jgi:hypothetical protein